MFGSLVGTLGEMNPFRYRGYVYDVESGLYYLRSRYYNPEWGRFINADTVLGKVGALGTHNLFAYCGNNPVMCVDPSGHSLLVVAACLFLYVLCQSGESGQSNTSTDSQAAQQDSFPSSSAFSTDRTIFQDWYWSLKGVYFEPNAGYANGGRIKNAALLSYSEMCRYVEYLNEKYGSIYQGSREGFMFEWIVHRAAYYVFDFFGDTDNAESALHYDFGATIYDDQHSWTPLMIFAYGFIFPYQSDSDLIIHISQ